MNETFHHYLSELRPQPPDWVSDLQRQAQEDHIPIMETDAMDVLLQLLRIHKPQHILEIGTGTGYSALYMASAIPNAHITTIEKDTKRHQKALDNIHALNMDKHITAVHGDAFETLEELQSAPLFDFAFIDAAKGQYHAYFKQITRLLSEDGLVVSDNVLFRGFVYDHAEVPKRFRHLVKQLKHFNKWLMNHPDFHTIILPCGDGVAVSSKKSVKEY